MAMRAYFEMKNLALSLKHETPFSAPEDISNIDVLAIVFIILASILGVMFAFMVITYFIRVNK